MNGCSRLSRCIVPPTVERMVFYSAHYIVDTPIQHYHVLLRAAASSHQLLRAEKFLPASENPAGHSPLSCPLLFLNPFLWEKTLLLSSFLKPSKPLPSFFSFLLANSLRENPSGHSPLSCSLKTLHFDHFFVGKNSPAILFFNPIECGGLET